MEQIIRTERIAKADGKAMVMEIVEDAERYEGQRAYAKGANGERGTNYYDGAQYAQIIAKMVATGAKVETIG